MADLSQIRSGFMGLTTARSPEQTPAGGLLEATNVVIRRPGTIEPRPGFDTAALPAAIASAGAKGHVEYPLDANEAGLIMDGTTTIWDGYSSFSSAVVTEDAAALTWESYKGVVARRSLFLLTGDALRAVHAPGATTAYRAGVPAPGLADPGLNAATVTSVAGPSYAANEYRAYRAVTFRNKASTAQSHEARSAPSSRLVNFRTTSGNAYFYILLHKTEDFLVGDVIEVYSTETSTTYPTDEMFLNQRVAITSAHITAGYVEIVDATLDDELGMDLYTNASREGAEGAHYRPPQAGTCAMFNNSLWLGDLTYPPVLQVTFPIKMFGGGSALGDTTMVNRYAVTCTFTAGSANFTMPAAPAGMQVGQLVILSHGTYRLLSYTATTGVLSAVWAGSSGAASTQFCDSIKIGSEYYPVADLVANISGVKGSRWHQQAYTASSLYAAEWSEGNPTAGAILAQNSDYAVKFLGLTLTCVLPTTTPPGVWATNGHLYSPALPEPSAGGTGVVMVQDVLPDHVAWSNQDEPDHFRLDNIDRVGGGGSTVMDMQPSGNSILLFTDMGAFRASGYADSGVSFNDLDPSVRTLGRLCATSSDRYTYALADSGVFECDENGCKNLTTNVLSDLDGFIMQAATARATTAHLVSNNKDDEVLVCLPAFYNTLPITRVYVFNTLQRAWTAWTLPLNAWVWSVKGRNRLLTATVENAKFLWVERSIAAGLPCADRDFAITVASVITSTNITISPGSGWTPAVGDTIQQAAANYVVTAITDAVRFTVHVAGLTAAAATAYEGVSCTVTPSVNTVKTPHFMKLWAEGSIHWVRRLGVYAYTLAFRSAITGADTASSQTRLLATAPSTNSGVRSAPAASRFMVPRAAARGTHLCFSLTVRAALADWAIEGLSVRVRTTADKAPARLP